MLQSCTPIRLHLQAVSYATWMEEAEVQPREEARERQGREDKGREQGDRERSRIMQTCMRYALAYVRNMLLSVEAGRMPRQLMTGLMQPTNQSTY